MSDEATSVRLALTLGFAGLLSGLMLVGIYELTLPTITANKAEALRKAVFEVVPGSNSVDKTDIEGVYLAFDDKTFKGFAIAGSGKGFQDDINLLYGFDPERRRIIGMRVLQSRETPGLGDKIFKDQAFVDNFNDLAIDPEIKLVKHGARSAPNEVDSITGATISSKAVVKIIQTASSSRVDLLPKTPARPATIQNERPDRARTGRVDLLPKTPALPEQPKGPKP